MFPNELSVELGSFKIADLIDVEGGMISDKFLELLDEMWFKGGSRRSGRWWW